MPSIMATYVYASSQGITSGLSLFPRHLRDSNTILYKLMFKNTCDFKLIILFHRSLTPYYFFLSH
jgi:hypothetical protein